MIDFEDIYEPPKYEDKADETKEPKPIIYEDSYGMTIPVCPNCHELAYEETHCVFCGTPFLPPVKRMERKREITGVDENGKCVKCGCAEFKTIAHMDGTDFYAYEYECIKCGNHATVKESREMFEVENEDTSD